MALVPIIWYIRDFTLNQLLIISDKYVQGISLLIDISSSLSAG